MTRRRKLAEQAAPWALMAILAALWWGGSRLVQWSGLSDVLPVPAAATRESEPIPPSSSTVPPPADVPDPLPASATPAASDDREKAKRPPLSPGGLPVITFQDITDLRRRALTVPVQGISVERLVSSYRDTRNGERRHEAMDIPAAHGTPVVAVEDGRIAKLFKSRDGGLTVYQFDQAEQFTYYYAHLDSYASGLKEGDPVHRGQTLGYVGTTGNAPANAPHLHFAIFKMSQERRWWEGTPLDPYVVWR